MGITPAEIESQHFRITFRGFDVQEADALLDASVRTWQRWPATVGRGSRLAGHVGIGIGHRVHGAGARTVSADRSGSPPPGSCLPQTVDVSGAGCVLSAPRRSS
jgi:DivIVA domain-containing protein